MAQVANEQELETALNNKETSIEVTANFNITSLKEINYTTSITSAAETIYTISKDANYDGSLFQTVRNGNVSFTNIILNGAKELHSTSTNGASLITVNGGALTLAQDSILQNNQAVQGGGIAIRNIDAGKTVLLMDNALIQNNTVTDGGGALFVSIAQEASIQITQQVRIEYNTALNGGAISFSSTTASLLIDGEVMLQENTASNLGGAIYISAGECQLQGSVILSNNTARLGGACYSNGKSITINEQVKLQNNAASGQGGALYLRLASGPNASIHAQFLANTASSGGAITYLLTAASRNLDFTNAQFIENTTTGSGSTVEIGGENRTTNSMEILLDHTTFRKNMVDRYATAIRLYFIGTMPVNLQINDSDFEENTGERGYGNLYIASPTKTTLTIQNSRFIKNINSFGTGIFLAPLESGSATVLITSTSFIDNTANYDGGAITLSSGTIDMRLRNVSFQNNHAGRNGGAIALLNSVGTLTIENGTEFTGNGAPTGGAIYQNAPSALEMKDSTFTNNTASTAGADLFLNGPVQFGGNVQLPDGIYINNSINLPVLSTDIQADSFLALESSTYITPNPQGTPIVAAAAQTPLTQEKVNILHLPATGFAGWETRISDDQLRVEISTIVYTIQYEQTLGVENPNPTSYTIVSPTITLLPLASLPTQKFLGWFDAATGGSEITEIPLGSTENKILYAQWDDAPIPTYYLQYAPHDDSSTPAQYIPEGLDLIEHQAVMISALIPIRDTYRFLHWNTKIDDTGISYLPQDMMEDITSNNTLYAQWSIEDRKRM